MSREMSNSRFNYKNEAEFSKSIVAFWRSRGYFVQLIETGTVNRGVPDIYVASKKGALWVELKRIHHNAYNNMVIPWRPGQQGWMLEHYITVGKACITIACCDDVILVIEMNKRFKKNIVQLSDCKTAYALKELVL